MRIGVPRQTSRRERRVAISPFAASKLVAAGHSVHVEVGAGIKAGFTDDQYREVGASVDQRATVIGSEGAIIQTAAPQPDELSEPGWEQMGPNHTFIGLLNPLWNFGRAEALLKTKAAVVSLELIPRITRAQSMDVLSSMATVAGYEAVLLASIRANRMFPMMMTAGGTIPPAKVVVLGAGVAGLQAISTAKRLGAVVEAYDIRPAAMEQILSVGAKPIELDLTAASAEDAGGYATAQADDFTERQHEALAPYVTDADIVVSTASIPGATSPELITTAMVDGMRPGSVIVDLAAEQGGNCRLTVPDDEVVRDGVVILGPTDLVSRAAETSSNLFANNVVNLLNHLAPDGDITWDLEDEISAGTLIGWDGEVLHPRLRQLLELPPLDLDEGDIDEPELIEPVGGTTPSPQDNGGRVHAVETAEESVQEDDRR